MNPDFFYLLGFSCAMTGGGFLIVTAQRFFTCPREDRFEKWAAHWRYWRPALVYFGVAALLIGAGLGVRP